MTYCWCMTCNWNVIYRTICMWLGWLTITVNSCWLLFYLNICESQMMYHNSIIYYQQNIKQNIWQKYSTKFKIKIYLACDWCTFYNPIILQLNLTPLQITYKALPLVDSCFPVGLRLSLDYYNIRIWRLVVLHQL